MDVDLVLSRQLYLRLCRAKDPQQLLQPVRPLHALHATAAAPILNLATRTGIIKLLHSRNAVAAHVLTP
jgi:hypothetical protein